jgi:hypothetical protein
LSAAEGEILRDLERDTVDDMKIDTAIRHVTKAGANVFLELGFAPLEARRLRAASRKQISGALPVVPRARRNKRGNR